MLALTQGREVGIDIEYMRRTWKTEKLADRFFSEREREGLLVLPREQKVAGFFRCWTARRHS